MDRLKNEIEKCGRDLDDLPAQVSMCSVSCDESVIISCVCPDQRSAV